MQAKNFGVSPYRKFGRLTLIFNVSETRRPVKSSNFFCNIFYIKDLRHFNPPGLSRFRKKVIRPNEFMDGGLFPWNLWNKFSKNGVFANYYLA